MRFILLIIILLLAISGYTQQPVATPEMFTSVSNSKLYPYIDGIYKPYKPSVSPDFKSMTNALTARKARYEYAHNIITTELEKLQKLTLVNKWNKGFLEDNRALINDWMDKNYAHADVGIEENFNTVLDYVTSLYRIESIKAELQLLNSIQQEINRLRQKDPETFQHSERYEQIKSALVKLQGVTPAMIPGVAVEFGIVEK
jgi:hypothetical protein